MLSLRGHALAEACHELILPLLLVEKVSTQDSCYVAICRVAYEYVMSNGVQSMSIDFSYPRPQLRRAAWVNLNGEWRFAEDPDDVGIREHWFAGASRFEQVVVVPFPPGSELSGHQEFSDCDVVWYSTEISREQLDSAGAGHCALLHFEAVDFHAEVWIDGCHVFSHAGGSTPFSVDLTPHLSDQALTVVVRAEDRKRDISQPRGKQDWRDETHGIWYRRSTGIWRDVWLEKVPSEAIENLWWSFDLETATVTLEASFSTWIPNGTLAVELTLRGTSIGRVATTVSGRAGRTQIHVVPVENRLEWASLLWAPGQPNLVDAVVQLQTEEATDVVDSYLGLRVVDAAAGYLRINREPVYVQAILDQGYWEESFFTAPSIEDLRKDLELAQAMGFNTLRAHQRVVDRRYLAMADEMGLMVWGEYPAAFEFSRRAIDWTTDEWMKVIDRDFSHPSVVVWVPFNESWGVSNIAHDMRQQRFVRGVCELTRAQDPTRPVIENDGWEQLQTDIITTHDYASDPEALAAPYADWSSLEETLSGPGPQGRRVLLGDLEVGRRPVMVSEFGGISLNLDDERAWGYAVAGDTGAYEGLVRELFGAIYRSPIISGFCYTQLTDTGQETNGLLTSARAPKIPLDTVRAIVTADQFALQNRPRVISEVSAGGEQ